MQLRIEAIQRNNRALMEIVNKIEKKKRSHILTSRTWEVAKYKQHKHKTQKASNSFNLLVNLSFDRM